MVKQITREHMDTLRDLTVSAVRAVVDHAEEVEVNIIPSSYRLIVELHTAPADVGQVIGKEGRVVSAIRTLLAAHGGKQGLKVDMDFITERSARR
jgi:uncharacterized protein